MRLRHLRAEDLETLFHQQCEIAAQRMAGFTARDRDSFMHHWTANVLGNPSGVARTIEVDGQIAGFVTSWAFGEHRFVAYWLGESFWGRGLATRALSCFLLDHEPARPLHATVAPTNTASVRVLEKCGFTKVTDERERTAVLGEDEHGIALVLS